MIKKLVGNLNNDDPYIRRQAAVDLGRMGPKAKSAVPALIEAFEKEETRSVHVFIIRAFGQIGPDAKEAIPVLKNFIDNEPGWTRFEALSALVEMGIGDTQVMSILLQAAKDEDTSNRARAVQILGEAGKYDQSVISELINALHDREVSIYAADSLGAIGETVIPYVSEAMHGLNYNTRNRVAQALGRIGPPAVPYLIELLQNGNRDKQWLAASTIRIIGPEAKEAVPHLIRLLGTENENLRDKIALALASIGESALPAVVDSLTSLEIPSHDYAYNDDNDKLKTAVTFLKYFGPEGGKRYTYRTWFQSYNAPVSISRLQQNSNYHPNFNQSTIQALVKQLYDPDMNIRRNAINNLQLLEKVPEEVTEVLMDLLDDKDEETRLGALFTLIIIKTDESLLLPILIKAAGDESAVVRSAAISLIGDLKEKENKDLDLIIKKALKDDDPIIRWCAALSLGSMAISRHELRPKFINIMKNRLSE